MDSKAELYLRRARTELDMATLLFQTSGSKTLESFNIDSKETFYSRIPTGL